MFSALAVAFVLLSTGYAYADAADGGSELQIPRAWAVVVGCGVWVLPAALWACVYRGTVCCPL